MNGQPAAPARDSLAGAAGWPKTRNDYGPLPWTDTRWHQSPQLLLDLDRVDVNLRYLMDACRQRGVDLRVHFKSLKCGSLARSDRCGGEAFLRQTQRGGVLADAGMTDIFVANEIIGPVKLARLARLARRADVRVCVDDVGNVAEMAAAARNEGVTLGVLVEVDVGMQRCGVEPGEPALTLRDKSSRSRGLRFVGLQGYDGHLQMLLDPASRREVPGGTDA